MKFFKSKKRIILLLIFLILIVISSFFLKEFIANYIVRLKMDVIEAPVKGEKVLIFSPHNDDEVLGAGEFIKQTLKNGGQVKVVLMTNGDGFKQAIQFDYFNLNPKPIDYIKFGYARQKESITALKKLGLSEKNIIFLGYPDGGMSSLWGAYWDKSNPYFNKNTESYQTPYNNSFTKGSLYCGENVVSDISKIIKDYKPTEVIYPHPNDKHPDHWATNAFVKYTLSSLNYQPNKQLLYLVHRGDWPTPMREETNMYLVPPAKLKDTGTKWYAFNLSSNDIAEKAEVIHVYKTQIKTLGPLLTAFERKNELFGEYDDFVIPLSNSASEEMITDKSNKAIIDPLQDTLNLQISRGSDVSAVYIDRKQDNSINIAGEMDGAIEENIKYDFNIIFFKDKSISKLNLEIENGKMTAKNISKQSITDIAGTKMNIKGNKIYVYIPEKVIGDFNHIFINMSTSDGIRMIDKTAWRMTDK